MSKGIILVFILFCYSCSENLKDCNEYTFLLDDIHRGSNILRLEVEYDLDTITKRKMDITWNKIEETGKLFETENDYKKINEIFEKTYLFIMNSFEMGDDHRIFKDQISKEELLDSIDSQCNRHNKKILMLIKLANLREAFAAQYHGSVMTRRAYNDEYNK